MSVRYAKQDVYADVEEEGGTISRLVAVKGKAVPAVYADLVADADTTTDIDEAHALQPSEEFVTETAPAAERPAGAEGGPQLSEALAEGYADLDVEGVLEALAEASPEDVAAVIAYEALHDGRQAILDYQPAPKLEEPLKGYDGLNVKQVVAELKDASEATVKAVKAYEDANQKRKGVLEFDPQG